MLQLVKTNASFAYHPVGSLGERNLRCCSVANDQMDGSEAVSKDIS